MAAAQQVRAVRRRALAREAPSQGTRAPCRSRAQLVQLVQPARRFRAAEPAAARRLEEQLARREAVQQARLVRPAQLAPTPPALAA